MRRSTVVRYRTSATKTGSQAMTAIAKSWHLHFCANQQCRIVFDCYDCGDVATNGLCHHCRGKNRPGWDKSRDPGPCCERSCQRVTTTEDLVRYRLAGPGPWYQCRVCARVHGWPEGTP